MNPGQAKECACGCGKLFLPGDKGAYGAFAFRSHDKNFPVKYQGLCRAYAKKRLKQFRLSPEDADDFASWAVCKFMVDARDNPAWHFKDWIRETLDRNAFRRGKKMQLPVFLSLDLVERHLSSEPSDFGASDEIMEAAIGRLAPRTQEMARLSVLGLTYKQIGKRYGLSESRVSQLMAKLRAEYAKAYVGALREQVECLKPIETDMEIAWIEIA